MTPELAVILSEFNIRIEQSLRIANYGDESNSSCRIRKADKPIIRGTCFVLMSAALEWVVDEIHKAILSLAETRNILKNEAAFVLLLNSELSTISSFEQIGHTKRIARVLDILREAHENIPIQFDSKEPPIDGKTLTDSHFKLLWDLFTLPGYHLPGNSHLLALRDVAEKRNNVAHGKVNPKTVGLSNNSVDITNLINKYKDVGEHFINAIDGWISTTSLKR